MNDRMINTAMSSKIVSALLKEGWTIGRIAKTLHAPTEFVEGVRVRRNVLTVSDITALSNRCGQSFNAMVLASLAPVKPQYRPLFDAVKALVDSSDAPMPHTQRRPTQRKTRSKIKAA